MMRVKQTGRSRLRLIICVFYDLCKCCDYAEVNAQLNLYVVEVKQDSGIRTTTACSCKSGFAFPIQVIFDAITQSSPGALTMPPLYFKK